MKDDNIEIGTEPVAFTRVVPGQTLIQDVPAMLETVS